MNYSSRKYQDGYIGYEGGGGQKFLPRYSILEVCDRWLPWVLWGWLGANNNMVALILNNNVVLTLDWEHSIAQLVLIFTPTVYFSYSHRFYSYSLRLLYLLLPFTLFTPTVYFSYSRRLH